jgi:hypothetical protein
MAALLWLAAAALLAFAYFLSTLFSKSRVAGLATALLYALAMVPGCATLGSAPTMQMFFSSMPPLVVVLRPWLAAAPMPRPARLLSALFCESSAAGLAARSPEPASSSWQHGSCPVMRCVTRGRCPIANTMRCVRVLVHARSAARGRDARAARAGRYLMPTVQPYGGRGWVLACLAPPSALSLFATVLLKFEGAQRGVTWAALGRAVTPQYAFSAATVLRMLALDVLLYAALAWYLDKARLPGPAAPALAAVAFLFFN